MKADSFGRRVYRVAAWPKVVANIGMVMLFGPVMVMLGYGIYMAWTGDIIDVRLLELYFGKGVCMVVLGFAMTVLGISYDGANLNSVDD